MHDVLIFLTARQIGYPVLTANAKDFDLIQQLAPDGKVIYYSPWTRPGIRSPTGPEEQPHNPRSGLLAAPGLPSGRTMLNRPASRSGRVSG
jgi:hypothetical protein